MLEFGADVCFAFSRCWEAKGIGGGAGGSFQLVCGNDVKWPGKIVQTLGPLGREIQRRLFSLGAEQGSLGLLSCNLLGSHVAPFLELQPKSN